MIDLPKYYEVDDILVIIEQDGDDVIARTVPGGRPYPPFKAAVDGMEITKEKFEQLLKERRT